MVHLHLKNSAQAADIFQGTWPTKSLQREDSRCLSFLARSSILMLFGSNYFQKPGSLEVQLSTSKVSILNFGEVTYATR